MKKHNAGFTLVELIVVMAILGVVSLTLGLSVSTSTSARAEKTAQSVNLLIAKCRAGCLSKSGDVHLTLSMSGDDLLCQYFENGTLVSSDLLAMSGITVSYATKKTDADPVTTSLALTPLTLSFDRSTGAQTARSDGSYCTAITFAGGRTYAIMLVPSTGLHKLI